MAWTFPELMLHGPEYCTRRRVPACLLTAMVRLEPFIKSQLVIRARGVPRRCGAVAFPHHPQ
jgi:hypothetical protein